MASHAGKSIDEARPEAWLALAAGVVRCLPMEARGEGALGEDCARCFGVARYLREVHAVEAEAAIGDNINQAAVRIGGWLVFLDGRVLGVTDTAGSAGAKDHRWRGIVRMGSHLDVAERFFVLGEGAYRTWLLETQGSPKARRRS